MKSTTEVTAPTEDLVSFAFNKQNTFDDSKPLYISADDPQQSLSYEQALRYIRQLISGLKAFGLADGDTVLVHLFNNYAYAPILLAIVGAGGVICATNPTLKSELVNIFDIARPTFVITTSDLLINLQKWVPGISLDQVLIFDNLMSPRCHGSAPNSGPGQTSLDPSLLSHGERDWKRLHTEEQMRKTPASYFLTSGTTGCPKLATLSHYSMVSHFIQIHQEVPYDVVRLCCLPLFHIFGSAWVMALTIRHGQPVYVMPRFAMDKYLEYVENFQITESCLAPPIVEQLNNLDPPPKSQLASLRFVTVGGAPITAATMCTFRSMLHDAATLSGCYGATEMGTISMFRYGEEVDYGSVGRPLPGAKIDLRPIEARQIGLTKGSAGTEAWSEIVVSVPSHMERYHGEFDNSSVNVQWYRTGDLGRMDKDKLYIVGKAKDIMKVNGFQVSPTEIEAVLLRHPDIVDCAVSKVVHNEAEMPRAYVVRRNQTLSEDDVVDFSRRQLISYKALTGGVAFVQRIPRLASGKIQRYKLVDMPLDTEPDRHTEEDEGEEGEIEEEEEEEEEETGAGQTCARSTRILRNLVRRAGLSGSWVIRRLASERWLSNEHWGQWSAPSIGLLSCAIGIGIWYMRAFGQEDSRRES
ncbi:hypothetical protein PFICI_14374 [Pestalotiopsis fici W106-1]|uniref:AMP-dependent synthetase/ligase domain-containing protein n=1 Tax=Pestalotiopsis fici (strain W106-1 / CGMCC3.15140) TaxID=1229662 RepID=W3WKU0_PESFW|nr:uncharacterized protein PFICI_14374 [Pestalotiopsis fici W106-1]ETS74508.1 hypothetical protein PFICI_14374 [Pestalotiopsis fici W106-1]